MGTLFKRCSVVAKTDTIRGQRRPVIDPDVSYGAVPVSFIYAREVIPC